MTDADYLSFKDEAHSKTPGQLAGVNGQCSSCQYENGQLQIASNHDMGFKPDMGPVPTA